MQKYSRMSKGLNACLRDVLQAYKHDVMRGCANDASITKVRMVIRAILETNATVARMQSFYAIYRLRASDQLMHRKLKNSIDTTR